MSIVDGDPPELPPLALGQPVPEEWEQAAQADREGLGHEGAADTLAAFKAHAREPEDVEPGLAEPSVADQASADRIAEHSDAQLGGQFEE